MASRREVDDETLAAQARAGDRGALAALLERHQLRLFNVALRVVGDREDAADVTQDALLQVVQRVHTYRGDARFTTWLTRVTINQAITFLRKRKRRPAAAMSTLGNGHGGGDGPSFESSLEQAREPSPAYGVEQDEQHARLHAALQRVDEDFRAVLVLRDIEQMDYAAIGQVLDLPLGTVKSRLFRGRLMLREMLRNPERDRRGADTKD
jgi:RNA polymerase sigma-70 factor, ECF subfamily